LAATNGSLSVRGDDGLHDAALSLEIWEEARHGFVEQPCESSGFFERRAEASSN
jgi:hypothetical protein